MKSPWILCMGLVAMPFAQAQAPVQRFPFAGVGGNPVPAHYVRLEGLGSDIWQLLQLNQRACARLGHHVEIPPEGTPTSHISVERYYTPTHLITYTHSVILNVSADCVLEWQEVLTTLKAHSPRGVCTFDLRRHSASGACGDHGEPVLPLPALRLNPQALGHDSALGCQIRFVQAHGTRVERCVEPRPASEAWRSYLEIGGPDYRGLLLAERAIELQSNRVSQDIRAVEVRRNITVGSDMLDLARTQGFSATPLGGNSRGGR
jgi:hypothetical protein